MAPEKCFVSHHFILPFHVPWTYLFQYGIWNIWRPHNKFLFEPSSYTLEELVKLTYSQACAYWYINFDNSPIHLQNGSQLISNNTRNQQEVPLRGFVTVRLHANFQHKRVSSFAGLQLLFSITGELVLKQYP